MNNLEKLIADFGEHLKIHRSITDFKVSFHKLRFSQDCLTIYFEFTIMVHQRKMCKLSPQKYSTSHQTKMREYENTSPN